jgi:8-amino-7-oxononanoate synthase
MLEITDRQRAALTDRVAENRLRRLRSIKPLTGLLVESAGRTLINFSSNDYLGLSQHPLLKERAAVFLNRYGTGCGASRLVSGNLDCYDALEEKLAALKGTETALVMNGGFQTNLTVLAALADDKCFIALDRLSHNSLLQGTVLSGAKWNRFKHNDLNDLERRLETPRARIADERWIVTESVFSMDGDRCDIDGLIASARNSQAKLFIDEAHSTGLFGEAGMGLAAGKPIDLIMGTFGKACGSFGSYVACSKTTREFLINCCSGFVYSTGLPPPVLGAIDAALELIPTMSAQRLRLSQMADHVRKNLKDMGYSTGESSTQIIPIFIGDDSDALSFSAHLENCGILATAIRPPTVPVRTARIRLSLSAAHTDEQIETLLQAIRSWMGPKK